VKQLANSKQQIEPLSDVLRNLCLHLQCRRVSEARNEQEASRDVSLSTFRGIYASVFITEDQAKQETSRELSLLKFQGKRSKKQTERLPTFRVNVCLLLQCNRVIHVGIKQRGKFTDVSEEHTAFIIRLKE
jgi:hypothetical protein